jgi:ABC-type uncharacterized transport system permease subunit
MTIVLYVLTAALYGGLASVAWRRHWRQGEGADYSSLPAPPRWCGERLLLAGALSAHGGVLYTTIFLSDSMIFGFAFAVSAMLWLSMGIYWLESFFFELEGLALLALPLACLASLLPLVFGGVHLLPYAATPLFKLHFVMANVAYGLLALMALHALLMLLVERRLHRVAGAPLRRAALQQNWFGNWLDSLPPLLTLEKLLFRLMGAGFVLLTLALLSGILFSEQLFDRALRFDHKTVFACLSWVMFGVMLIGRRFYGWRGRVVLRWILAAFVTLLLAYIGSHFVFEVLLPRRVV